MNLGATVTSNMEGQASTPLSSNQSDQPGQGQTYPPQTAPSPQQTGQGPAGPRVIRISHQAVPVVMMQMNTDGVLSHNRHRSNVLLCITSSRPAAPFHGQFYCWRRISVPSPQELFKTFFFFFKVLRFYGGTVSWDFLLFFSVDIFLNFLIFYFFFFFFFAANTLL